MTRPDPSHEKLDSALKSVAEAGELPIRINGRCMAPLIEDNARVLIHKQSFYWPGDVVVKRCASGQLVAHRLIGTYPRNGGLNIITRADDADKADPAIASTQIIGRVAGGECAEAVVHVPLPARIKSLGQFVFLLVSRIFTKSHQRG